MTFRWSHILTLFGVATLALGLTAACTRGEPSPTPSPTPLPATSEPTATTTPSPPRLVVCGMEPEAVHPFAPSLAGNDLLALFFEPPVEQVSYGWEARLVTHVPSPASGDVSTQTVAVPQGTRYADPAGTVHIHEGEEMLSLPQLVVTFTLHADLRWSDGDPLNAEDVLLGYHLAQSKDAYGPWSALVERTSRFIALDGYRLRWEGIPGYLTTDYPGFLFPPQPAHRWQGLGLTQILQDRTPLATGPFRIVAWEAKHEVLLQPNPHYTGAAPALSEVIFRFPQQEPSGWYDLLIGGQCDVILPDPMMSTDWRQWSLLANQGNAAIWADVAPVVLRLEFNLDPPENDAPIADLAVRQAVAYCIDRASLSEALPGLALLPAESFVPPGHPAYRASADLQPDFNPDVGMGLLEEAGWVDADEDGLREAQDVAGIADGEPLSLTLHLAPQYFLSAAHISADLERCGIGVAPLPTEVQLLYAADAVSPLFGRSFDVALFGWEAQIPEVCGAWRSDRIPGEENAWNGENFSGFASEEYDAACRQALRAIEPEAMREALHEAQALLSEELPTIFLTWRPYWFVARPEVQNLRPDASAVGALWNVENVRIEE